MMPTITTLLTALGLAAGSMPIPLGSVLLTTPEYISYSCYGLSYSETDEQMHRILLVVPPESEELLKSVLSELSEDEETIVITDLGNPVAEISKPVAIEEGP